MMLKQLVNIFLYHTERFFLDKYIYSYHSNFNIKIISQYYALTEPDDVISL